MPTDTSNQYEVEVKTLLGSEAKANAFLAKLSDEDPTFAQTGRNNQLNHYFDEAGDPEKLPDTVKRYLRSSDLAALRQILSQSKSFALRSRDTDGKILLVVKAAIGNSRDGDNQHAIERLEGEYETSATDIDTLDASIRSAGYGFLSKWSRNRKEYKYKDFTVTIDKNAGYGYIAELEKVVPSSAQAAEARREIIDELKALGAEELSQARVGRMFDYYNEHWPEYYRTEKTFTIK